MKGDPVDPSHERILDIVRAERAPARLRERLAAERRRTVVRRLVVRRMKLTGALAAAAAALGVVVGLATSGGGRGAPSPFAAAALASRGAAGPAPALTVGGRSLRVEEGGIAFPAWRGWRAVGQRTDDLGGRSATTVFYVQRGGSTRVGYTIVDGRPLPWPQGGRRVRRRGVEIRTARRGGRVMAFWRVRGRTCVLSAATSVPRERLVELASRYVA